MRKVKLFLLTLMVVYAGIVSYFFVHQKSLMYHPVKEMDEFSSFNLPGAKETFIESSDGVLLQTWYAMPKTGMPMIVYFHGNAVNLSTRVLKFRQLEEMGYGFVAITYRGFGKSGGYMSEEGIYNDARAGIKYAQSLGYNPQQVILIGESLGTGVATKMATEYDFKGVLLITPYTSIADRGQEMYPFIPVKSLLSDNFSSYDNIGQIDEPIFIIHGDQDEIVPHTHSFKLVEKIKSRYELVIYPGIKHTNYDSQDVFNKMSDFFGVQIVKPTNTN